MRPGRTLEASTGPTPCRRAERIIELPNLARGGMSRAMERLFGNPSYRQFTLQDRKRLPARFFAAISGAKTARLR